MTHQHHQPVLSLSADLSDTTWIGCRVGLLLQVAAYPPIISRNNNNIRLLKIDKPQLNTEMLNVKVIHT